MSSKPTQHWRSLSSMCTFVMKWVSQRVCLPQTAHPRDRLHQMVPYQQMEIKWEEMGKQRVLALQIHKQIVYAKGRNDKKKERREEKNEIVRESERQRRSVPICIVLGCLRVWGVSTDHDWMDAQMENHFPWRDLSLFPLPSSSATIHDESELSSKRAAHFSTLIFLYSKVSWGPSHACSILDDILNPIYPEIHLFISYGSLWLVQ